MNKHDAAAKDKPSLPRQTVNKKTVRPTDSFHHYKSSENFRPCLKIGGVPDWGRFFTQRACDIRKAAEPPTAIQSPGKAIGCGNPDGFQVKSTQSWRKRMPRDGVLPFFKQGLVRGSRHLRLSFAPSIHRSINKNNGEGVSFAVVFIFIHSSRTTWEQIPRRQTENNSSEYTGKGHASADVSISSLSAASRAAAISGINTSWQ